MSVAGGVGTWQRVNKKSVVAQSLNKKHRRFLVLESAVLFVYLAGAEFGRGT